MVQPINKRISGCLCGLEDGNAGPQVEGAMRCPLVHSLNNMKSTGDRDCICTQSLSNSTRGTDDYKNDSNKLIKKMKTVMSKTGTKQGIKIATLNIHGKSDKYGECKYKRLTTIIRKNRIAILAIQESRLNNEYADKLMRENPKITIISNGSDTSKSGVAFILNNELIKEKKWNHTSIVNNSVSRLQIEWCNDNTLDLINLHFPNVENEKKTFATLLHNELKEIPKTSNIIIMGDFNFVEDKIDRCPHVKDGTSLIKLFKKITKRHCLVDGWRLNNPDEKSYTYLQDSSGSRSRIDRIYINKTQFPLAYNWDTTSSASLSDHDIAYVEILRDGLPYIGKGLWRLNTELIEYSPFRKKVRSILKDAEGKLDEYEENKIMKSQTELSELRLTQSPQIIWDKLKKQIKEVAVETRKERDRKLNQRHALLKAKLKKLNNTTSVNERPESRIEVKKIINELRQDSHVRIQRMQSASEARYKKEGETCSRYWFNLNKTKKHREPIMALINKRGRITSKTKEMTQIASEYHRDLLKKPLWDQKRSDATNKLLNKVETKLSEEENELLKATITCSEIEEALKSAKQTKAPGFDGIPYEFWKDWAKHKDELNEPDIVKMLWILYTDIEQNGIQNEDFTKAVMSLAYKKKDKRQIENYRPLALLNTDYKIYTKTIAKKLGRIAPSIIHEDQAGFIPGRSLYDHTRTTHATIEYCEISNKNGCIISLDQEKAYDKIDHEYLWKALERYGFPQIFVKRIQEIYKNTKTHVMINGVVPSPIDVQRGVRQGDPMSCILYDIAIEPLANAIRKSNIKGIEIPNTLSNQETTRRRILVSLFADDTLVYLGERDSFSELNKIIKLFCDATTAKFNLEKTEYLPIGSRQHRIRLIQERKIGNVNLDTGAKIIGEGEAMRTLGSWVGNNTHSNEQWQKILDDQQRIMETWHRSNLSLRGRELILKSLVQSKALFLATVNGMPKDVMIQMKKQMKDFLWSYKTRGLIKWDTVIQGREKGGLGIPDIESRTEAIHVMWLKKWLSPRSQRPIWAYLVDEIIKLNVQKKPIVDEASRINWIMQSWHESEAVDSKISTNIREMLRVARKYKTGFDSPKISLETKLEMPIWHHHAIQNNYYWNKKAARCLRNNHKITKVEDLINYIQNSDRYGRFGSIVCESVYACNKIAKMILNLLPDKYNPVHNTPIKDNLSHTPTRIRKYKRAKVDSDIIAFNPDITEKGDMHNAIRIFQKHNTYKKRRLNPETRKPAYRDLGKSKPKKITIYTDGSATGNGSMNGTSGIGIWRREGSARNRSLRLRVAPHSNTKAELMAIIAAVENNKHDTLTIKSDSENVLRGIIYRMQSWEDSDWLNIKHANEWKYLAYLLRSRTAITQFKWVKGHDTIEGNNMADELADAGAHSNNYYEPNLTVPKEFRIDGARLQSLTQAKAYGLLIRLKATQVLTQCSAREMNETQNDIETQTGLRPTVEKVWTTLKCRIIKHKMRDFLWKSIHKRIKCGDYFQHITTMTECQFCTCNQIENIDHILFQCEMTGVIELWREVGVIWSQITSQKWIVPTMGVLKGIGLIQIKSENKNLTSLEYLYKTLISETAWTIWITRNKRIFNEIPMTFESLLETWKNAIRRRIIVEFSETQLYKSYKRDEKIKEFERIFCINNILSQLEQDNKGVRLNF
jgi:ribonuclease HI/exonuclease III